MKDTIFIPKGTKFGHVYTLESVELRIQDADKTWVHTRCDCQTGDTLISAMYSSTRVDLLIDAKVTDCSFCFADFDKLY